MLLVLKIPVPETETKPEKSGKTAPNKEDHRPGKVKALHEAGWSNAKIADEMKCSTWSVSMILKELREQKEKQNEVNTDE